MSNSFSNKSVPSVPSVPSNDTVEEMQSIVTEEELSEFDDEDEYDYTPENQSLEDFNVHTQCVLGYSFVTLYLEPDNKTFTQLVVDNANAFGIQTDADSLGKINVRFGNEYLAMDSIPEVGKIYTLTSTHETKGI